MTNKMLALIGLITLTAARKAPEPRIVNGIPIAASKYPWIVSLRYDYVDQAYRFYDLAFCGASLIQSSPPVVLTAAHCVDSFLTDGTDIVDWEGDAIRLFADVNRTRAENGFRLREVTEGDAYQTLEFDLDSIVIHPEWNTSKIELGYDIALLFFNDQTVIMDEANLPSLPAAQLSGDDACCTDGEPLIAIGYGMNDSNESVGSATATLEETTLHNVALDECVDTLTNTERFGQWSWYIDESVMCAVGEDTDTCQGDSGGPLIRMVGNQPMIMGLTSWGFGCALPGLPGVYTSTAHFRNWISSTISWKVDGGSTSPTSSPTPSPVTPMPTEAPTIPTMAPSPAPTTTIVNEDVDEGNSNPGIRLFCVYGAVWSAALLLMS